MPSPETDSRKLAWDVLRQWKPEGMFAEELIDRAARNLNLSGPNRGLLNALVLGVIRNRTLLDAWIDHLRGGGALQKEVRDLLRLGLVQIMIMELPEHAAVNETVELAGRAKSIVNAILRRAVRSRAELKAIEDSIPSSVKFSVPEFLLSRWKNNLGAKAMEALAEWVNLPAATTVRANKIKYRAEARVAALPGAKPVEGFPGFYTVKEPPVGLLDEGMCYAQDPSTSLAPVLLAPEKHMTVLDACAAPGGKTAHLAQLMFNHGQILAVDSVEKRVKRLAGNLKNLSVHIAETLQHDWLAGPLPDFYQQRFRDGFDRVLIDAPCSNTGVMRRRVDVRWRLTPQSFQDMQEQQLALLKAIAPLVKIGGRLVYSTCSIEAEENEGTTQKFLAAHPNFKQLEMKRTLPHRDGVDGGFAALLERKK
jgi:16S rRNA (cytosine967-C5)-methyltransferase